MDLPVTELQEIRKLVAARHFRPSNAARPPGTGFGTKQFLRQPGYPGTQGAFLSAPPSGKIFPYQSYLQSYSNTMPQMPISIKLGFLQAQII